MARFYGCLPKTHDALDYAFRAPAPYTGAFVDLAPGFPEVPYDQLQLGSCVPNGTAAAVDFARVKQGLKPLNRPSRLFIYFQGRVRGGYPIDQDSGLEIRDGFKVIAADGAPPETDWPYNIDQFTVKPAAVAYTDGAQDQAVKYGAVQPGDVDATVASGYPVVFGVTLYDSFESQAVDETGVVPVPGAGESQVGGHCMVIVSTPRSGKDIPGGNPALSYRKVRNSWGTSWGASGYCWVPLQVFDRWASDFWVVTAMEDPNGPTPPAPTPPGPAPFPGPTPGPAPSAVELAALALVGDPVTADWLTHHHVRETKHVAALVQAVAAAAAGSADAG